MPLPNDSGIVIPAWMFDVEICARMKVGMPQVSMASLEDVRVILSETRLDCSLFRNGAKFISQSRALVYT
jgi:hypothetical protein